MNTVVIIIVPIGATQQDLDNVRSESFASTDTDMFRKDAMKHEPFSGAEWPLWTWFLPNPCR